MAGDSGRRGELSGCPSVGRFFAGRVDHSWSERRALSRRVRILDWLYRIHLAAGARAHVEGVNLRLCESCGGGVSGLADSARTGGPFYCDGKRDSCTCGDSGNQRESERENGDGENTGSGVGGIVVPSSWLKHVT